MKIQPMVLDLSHHNTVQNFKHVRSAGIVGIIHKSSQGTGMVDKTYAGRRTAALDAGLLWGAYHFADSSDVDKQISNFMKAAKPDDRTLMALDFEPNGARTMSISQARDFLKKIERELGRKAILYSGNLIKETLRKPDLFFAAHRLWLAQYGPVPRCPASWEAPWLWQFTGDGSGPAPHSIKGIAGSGIDINSYAGTTDQLIAEWTRDARADDDEPGDQPVVAYSVSANSLNLRAEASATSAVIETLSKGAKVEALPVPAEMNGPTRWLKVKVPSGKVGWMSAKFLDVAK